MPFPYRNDKPIVPASAKCIAEKIFCSRSAQFLFHIFTETHADGARSISAALCRRSQSAQCMFLDGLASYVASGIEELFQIPFPLIKCFAMFSPLPSRRSNILSVEKIA